MKALNSKGVLQQFFLLLGVHRRITTSRGRRRIATGVLEEQALLVRSGDTTHVMLAAVPGALVHRFFLTPDDMLEVLVRCQSLGQIVFRERIELLDTHDGDIFAAFGTTLLQQIVVNLAAAQDQADRKSTRLNSSHVKTSYAV